MRHALVASMVLAASTAAAQLPPDHPPTGQLPPDHPPTQQLPPGHPPTGAPAPTVAPTGEAMPPGHPPVGPAGARQQISDAEVAQEQQQREQRTPAPEDVMHRILQGEAPQLAVAQPDESLPTGTVRVLVADADRAPVQGALVQIGVLAQGGARDTMSERTDAEGLAVFSDLATGSGQAYRVKVPVEGALFATSPFQLPPRGGYAARITLLPTTTDARAVMQLLSRTFLELRDERVHVVQQMQLVNMAMEVYTLPEEGKAVRLPDGFTAFQSQAVMTDQRFEATDEGFRLRGSLPPGRVTLVYAFDLPVGAGEDLELEIAVPFRTYEFRVESDAPPGLTLDVRGLPEPEEIESDAGRQLLITAKRFRPDEAQPSVIRISVSGLPGPGPARWIALGGTLIMLFVALMFSFSRSRGDRAFLANARKQRRRELLDEALDIERMFESGEIGPKYRSRRMEMLVEELAGVLHEGATAAAIAGTSGEADEADATADEAPLTVGYNKKAAALLVLAAGGAAVFDLAATGIDADFLSWAPVVVFSLLSVYGLALLVVPQVTLRGRELTVRNGFGMVTGSWTLDDLGDLVVDDDGMFVELEDGRERVRNVGGLATDRRDLAELRKALRKPARKTKKKTKRER